MENKIDVLEEMKVIELAHRTLEKAYREINALSGDLVPHSGSYNLLSLIARNLSQAGTELYNAHYSLGKKIRR